MKDSMSTNDAFSEGKKIYDKEKAVARRDEFIKAAMQGCLAGGMRSPKEVASAAIGTADKIMEAIDAGFGVNQSTGRLVPKFMTQAPLERPAGETSGPIVGAKVANR